MPDHLIPIEPASKVADICHRLTELQPSYAARLELEAFRESQTPHDARRLANALRHVDGWIALADELEKLATARGLRSA